jgi:hypothetical protein
MSFNTERMNAFQRAAAKPALADDRKNRYQRHDELEAKRRALSDTQAERVDRRAAQRAAWAGPGRSDVRTASGVKVTPELAALKQASDASRTASKIQPDLSAEDVMAIVDYFKANTPDYVPTGINGANLYNATRYFMDRGEITWSVAGLRRTFAWMSQHGYVEKPHDPRALPPKIFAEYLEPEELEFARAKSALANALIEEHAANVAKSKSFEELQKEVRSANQKFATKQEPF